MPELLGHDVQQEESIIPLFESALSGTSAAARAPVEAILFFTGCRGPTFSVVAQSLRVWILPAIASIRNTRLAARFCALANWIQ